MAKEPFSRNEARKHASAIVAGGGCVAVPSPYLKKRLAERNMTMIDVEQILSRGTIHEEAELEGGRWRYRLHFAEMCAVIQFEGEMELTVVTVWRRGA